MVGMTDISPAAKAAQETARTAGGQFGVQQHTAPEATLAPASHHAAVDAVLAGRDDRPMTRAETRELMLAALAEHARENPALAIITANGTNTTTGDVELIDLQYTDSNWDNGDTNDELVTQATEDLERLRVNGMDRGRHGWDVREVMASRLDDDHGITEWFNEETHSIGGRFGDHVTVEASFDDTAPVEVRTLDGDLVSTHPTHDAARAAAEELA